MSAGLIAAGLAVVSIHAAAPTSPQGMITAREFLEIGGGTAVADLTGNAKFPNSPDVVAYPSYFEWPVSAGMDISTPPPGNVKNNYGVQIVGYFFPPTTGAYVFAIAADDGAELWLSTNSDPANRKRIATEPTWNPVRAFTATARRNVDFPENNSSTYQATQWTGGAGAPITLTANTAYYIEALMKEGGGGDNLAVAVTDPGGTIDATAPIPGAYLATIDRSSLANPYFGEVFRPFPAGFDLQVFDGAGAGARTVASATAKLNGATIPVTVATTPSGKFIRYRITAPATGALGYLASGNYTNETTMVDSGGTSYTTTKVFALAAYATIPASQKLAAAATTPGLNAFIHQIDGVRGPGDGNSPANAEQQIGAGIVGPDGTILPNVAGVTTVTPIDYVNWDQDGIDIDATPEDGPDNFNSGRPAAAPVANVNPPGVPGGAQAATDNIVGEITGYAQLARGAYRMGVNSDDGFTVRSGRENDSPLGVLLGQFAGGRGASDTLFDFVVEEAGYYPIRLLWWEGTGGGNVEWFTEDVSSFDRTLVNGPGASLVKTFRNGSGGAHVDSIDPSNGFTGGATNQVVTVVISDAATQVVTGSVKLSVNGIAATPAVTKSGALTTVKWTPTGMLPFGSTQTFTLVFDENTTPARSVTNTFSFLVKQPSLLDLPQPLFFIEIEDFNYDGGKTNPQKGTAGLDIDVMPYDGGAYADLGAVEGVDYNNNDGNDANNYRTEMDENGENEVNMDNNLTQPNGNGLGGTIPVSGPDRGTWTATVNFKLGWVEGGSWQNYTRTVPAGWYTARAAMSYDGTADGQLTASLDRVTSDATQPAQTVERLGQFSAPGSGGWGNNNLVPMTTATGAPAAFKAPGGAMTFRFNLGSGDVNYFLIHKVAAPPPSISSSPNDSVKRDAVMLTWTLTDSDVLVNTASVALKIDGTAAPAAKVTVTKTASGATVVFNDTGTTWVAGEHTWELSFRDSGTPSTTVTGNGVFVVNPYPTPGTFVIEAEDFNYSTDDVTGGKSNPMAGQADQDVNVMPYLGGAYAGLSAISGVDYNGNDGEEANIYRTEKDSGGLNAVNMGQDLGNRYASDRGTYSVTANYRLGWVGNGEWQNYTRTIPQGNYKVWAALSFDGRSAGQLDGRMERVTSDPALPNQTTAPLGTFNAPGSGGWGRNELVPMKSSGAIATVALGGTQTLRFYSTSGDFDYILLVPDGPIIDPGTPKFTSVVKNPNGSITITWTGGGTLQSSANIIGPWADVPGATSPFTLTPPAGTATLFGRIKK